MKIGCWEVPKPTYPSLLWLAEWKAPAPLARIWHFCPLLAHLVPCWWVGWWLWRAVSRKTPIYFMLLIVAVTMTRRGQIIKKKEDDVFSPQIFSKYFITISYHFVIFFQFPFPDIPKNDSLWFTVLKCGNGFLSDPSPIIGYACHSLTHWLTNWLTNWLTPV